MSRMRCRLLVLPWLLAAGCTGPGDGGVTVIDDFNSAAAWSAHPADGVGLDLGIDPGLAGGALRLDFRFDGGGYAIARREVDLDLPANYVFRFKLRGNAPANTLEFKLVDESGENVWWHVRRDLAWPAQWQDVTIRKRQIAFAWGPRGGGELRHVAAIEFAVTAGQGGTGTVWIDDLELVPLPERSGPPPSLRVTASSDAPDHGADLAVDGDPATAWQPAPDDAAPQLVVDLGPDREFGGLSLDWAPGRRAVDYGIEASADGAAWTLLHEVRGGGGDRDDLFLPESAARYLRLSWSAPAGPPPRLCEFTVQPLAIGASREVFFSAIAGEARRGLYPRGLLGEQVFWTVVGADHATATGLVGSDGACDAGAGQFSLEPFLRAGGRLLTWADVTSEQTLAPGSLPIPTVTWRRDDWELSVTVCAAPGPGWSGLVARYRLVNRAAAPRTASLAVALRPFQVNPPSQFLNVPGGCASVGSIARRGDVLVVDGQERIRLPGPPPDHYGAAAFAAGDPVRTCLETGDLAALRDEPVDDPFGAASAVMVWDLDLPAGGEAERDVAVAWPGGAPPPPPPPDQSGLVWSTNAYHAAVTHWRGAFIGYAVTGPPAAAEVLRTLQAQLGYILVNRAGPAIRPGSRAYARSWIRDGALTGQALLRLGRADAAREFLEWYAPHQYANGKIPCVVDDRGADPVPEHDSTGEFIFLVAEVYRYTHDLDLLREMWPRVAAGIGYLESLLDERRTDAWRAADRRGFYGILPPSISHEGYSAKPMHSYWDDFFAARGYKDAAWLADELVRAGADSLAGEAPRLAAARDRFLGDLGASVAAAMVRHGIDYVPGCADLGDFDPTSTTIALAPAEVQGILPPGALARTFDRYWAFFTGRRDGEPWEAFTPYELRNVGTCVRLGRRERAAALLDWFLQYRRPAGWRHWAEVVRYDEGTAHFLGDMPHTWVGSDYIRSVLDMFAYAVDTDTDDRAALVLAAGLPAAWLEEPGVGVIGLPTPFGVVRYSLVRSGDEVSLEIGIGLLTVPPGGVVLRPPQVGTEATVDGRPVPTGPGGEVILHHLPARVVWRAAN